MSKNNRFRVLVTLVAAALVASLLAAAPLFAAPGDLDPAFGSGGKVTTDFSGFTDVARGVIAVQPDGKIVAAGDANNGSDGDFALARYNPDGSLDTTFGVGGKVITPIGSAFSRASALAVQPDGKIVAAGISFNGSDGDFTLARYNPDGSLDAAFGSGGKVTTDFKPAASTTIDFSNDNANALAVQPDGKIVAAGEFSNIPTSDLSIDVVDGFALARYNPDGSLDAAFGSGGKVAIDFGSGQDNDRARALAIQPDGKIVAAGRIHDSNGIGDFGLARYNPDGSLDAAFGSGGIVTTSINPDFDEVRDIAIQEDGRIVAAGSSFNSLDQDFALARYNPDGSLDAAFGSGGIVITDFRTDFGSDRDVADGIAIQEDGRIVAAGAARNDTSSYDFALARYNANGSLDAAFGSGGMATTNFGTTPAGSGTGDEAYGIAIQADGKIVAAGESYNGTDSDFALARYDADGTSSTDSASQTFGPGGGTVSTNGETTAKDPLGTQVTTPVAGTVSIQEGTTTGTEPSGFTFLSQQVSITASAATTDNPLVFVFRIDASLLPAGADETTIEVFRNGTPVPECKGPAGVASPDPCVSNRAPLTGGGVEIGVLTSQASTWNFGLHDPYAFSGFFRPVDNLPAVNVVKAGSAIPVKFSLGGDMGLDIFAAGSPSSGKIPTDPSAPLETIERTVTAGASGLSYNPTTGQYTYVWKTSKDWTGQTRQLVVKLNDGTEHKANFQFK